MKTVVEGSAARSSSAALDRRPGLLGQGAGWLRRHGAVPRRQRAVRHRREQAACADPVAAPSFSRDEKTIYVGSGDPNWDPGGTLYALGTDGGLRWEVERLDGVRVSGPVAAPDGAVLVTARAKVHKFSADGSKMWESSEFTASRAYAGAMDGKMYALKPHGRLLWSYQTGDNIDEHVPAIGPDGTLYFSSADGYIYALADS